MSTFSWSISVWNIFFSIFKCQIRHSSMSVSTAHRRVHIQTIKQVKMYFVLFQEQHICWYTFPWVTSQCVCCCVRVRACVHLPLVFYLTTESVTNGYVRAWWSTAIALLGTKLLQNYIDSSREKSCLNQPHIIWVTKKDVQLLIERARLPSWRKITL